MQIETTLYKKIAIFLGIVLFAVLAWYFSKIVIYILISLILSLLGRPIRVLLKKVKFKIATHEYVISDTLAATITILILMFIFGGLIFLIFPTIIHQVSAITSYGNGGISSLLQLPFKDLEDAVNREFPNAGISFEKIIYAQLEPLLSLDFVKNTIGYFMKMIVDIVVGLFCVFFITFFFLKDKNMFARWMIAIVPTEYEARVTRIMDVTYKLQVRYIVGITIESFVKFVLLLVCFVIFGLPLKASVAASAICAIFNVIPYVGPIIGGLVAIIIGMVSAPPTMVISELVTYMIISMVAFQILDNIVLQPYIYASSVKAHPLEIFIVIIMAGYIAGVWGMLFAIPVYTLIRVLAKEFLSKLKIVRDLTTNL